MSECRPVGSHAIFAQNPGLTPRAIAFRPFGALKEAGTFLSPKEFFMRPMRRQECPLGQAGLTLGQAAPNIAADFYHVR